MYLEFSELFLSAEHRAKAVHVSFDTPTPLIVETLGLTHPVPTLVLSTGAGLMPADDSTRLIALFDTLANYAHRYKMTVIDGGTHAGGMALMGAALAKLNYSVPHLGVLPAHAQATADGMTAEALVDPNHTHFVLLDNDHWGSEVPLMSAIASYLSQGEATTILVNGGMIAKQEILQSLAHGRPVIVVAGTGRLADTLAEALQFPQKTRDADITAIAQSNLVNVFDLSAPPSYLVNLLDQILWDDDDFQFANAA